MNLEKEKADGNDSIAFQIASDDPERVYCIVTSSQITFRCNYVPVRNTEARLPQLHFP